MSTPIEQNTIDLQTILDAVNALPEASTGVELPELTNPGTSADLLSGKELIDQNGEVVTGTIATKTASDLTASGATVTVPAGYYATQATKNVSTATQATPSVTVSSAGLITASATQTAGYVAAGTKSGTKQLSTQAAKTVTPSKSSQTAVASGKYTTGAVTVAAIPSEYVDVSGATASESDVMSGKTFGAGTAVKTGTFTLDSELTEQESLISQIATALEGKAAGSGSSGGAAVETGELTYSEEMDAPGTYLYSFASDNLTTSDKLAIFIKATYKSTASGSATRTNTEFAFYRESVSESFTACITENCSIIFSSIVGITITPNGFEANEACLDTKYNILGWSYVAI